INDPVLLFYADKGFVRQIFKGKQPVMNAQTVRTFSSNNIFSSGDFSSISSLGLSHGKNLGLSFSLFISAKKMMSPFP
ncbi:MAG: hypothetical protein II103_11240, partial [Treponema sp.]|nr:hypothetical protein [Treponema sp.]